MQRFIAIAPVVKLDNMESKLIQDLKENVRVVNGVKNTLGMEVMTKSSMNNLCAATFLKSALGTYGSAKVIEKLSDSDPSLIS